MEANSENRTITSNSTLRWATLAVNINWWMGWVAAGMLVLLIAAMIFFDFNARYSILPLEVTLIEDSAGEILNPIHGAGSIPIVGFSSLRVLSTELPALRYLMFAPVLLIIGFLWLIYLLRRFLANVRCGDLFSIENPKLLIRIGWLVFVSEPVYSMLTHLYGWLYLSAIKIPGASVAVASDFKGLSLVAGLVILVIAQAYRSAAQLKADAELTI